jgi:hypothetical protein
MAVMVHHLLHPPHYSSPLPAFGSSIIIKFRGVQMVINGGYLQ